MVRKRYGDRRGRRMVKGKAVGRRVKDGRKMVKERKEAHGSGKVGKESVELVGNGQVQAEVEIGVAEVDHQEVMEAEATMSRQEKMRATTPVQ